MQYNLHTYTRAYTRLHIRTGTHAHIHEHACMYAPPTCVCASCVRTLCLCVRACLFVHKHWSFRPGDRSCVLPILFPNLENYCSGHGHAYMLNVCMHSHARVHVRMHACFDTTCMHSSRIHASLHGFHYPRWLRSGPPEKRKHATQPSRLILILDNVRAHG